MNAPPKLRESILACFRDDEQLSPSQVQSKLMEDTEFDDPVQVRQALSRMVTADLLEKPARGLYRLHPTWHRRAATVPGQVAADIRIFLRTEGGVACTKDIHRHIWDRPKGSLERPYEYRLVTSTLSRSHWFSQEFGRGYWNLEAEELRRLPRLGRWTAKVIARRGGDLTCRDEYFSAVGDAFSEARGDLSLSDVVGDLGIRAALGRVAERVSRLHGNRFLPPNALGARRCVEWLSATYRDFENGRVSTHLAAHANFYRACGSLFEVSGSALSRGRVERPDVPDSENDTNSATSLGSRSRDIDLIF